MNLTIEQVNEIFKKTIYKPTKYLHLCTGGAPKGCERINFWSNNQIEQCSYASNNNWMCPWCKTCDGQHKGWSKLTDWEQAKNIGMKEFVDKLKEEILNDNNSK